MPTSRPPKTRPARVGPPAPHRPARSASPPPPSNSRGPAQHVRLQRILAAAGVASRRGAEALLRAGRVSVNGEPAALGQSADPERDVVTVDGVRVAAEGHQYWLVHKPPGVITTARDPQGRPTVVSLVPEAGARVFPVGRLDRDTEGLVLLTNDGALTQVLLHPSHETEREYRVTVKGRVDDETLRRLERGIRLEEGVTAPARAGRPAWNARKATTRFALTLVEGRKRQIRRSLARLGHPVVRLVRVRMGPLRLGRLAPGAARRLRPEEEGALRKLREAGPGRAGSKRRQPAGPDRKSPGHRPVARSRGSKPPSR